MKFVCLFTVLFLFSNQVIADLEKIPLNIVYDSVAKRWALQDPAQIQVGNPCYLMPMKSAVVKKLSFLAKTQTYKCRLELDRHLSIVNSDVIYLPIYNLSGCSL